MHYQYDLKFMKINEVRQFRNKLGCLYVIHDLYKDDKGKSQEKPTL